MELRHYIGVALTFALFAGPAAIANAIRDMGALLHLDMSKNYINYDINGEAAAVAGKALSDALAANTVLIELDLSHNYLKPEFAKELAVGIRDNRSLTSLNLAGNYLQAKGAKHIAKAIKVSAWMRSFSYQFNVHMTC
jgi:hypothetical protein